MCKKKKQLWPTVGFRVGRGRSRSGPRSPRATPSSAGPGLAGPGTGGLAASKDAGLRERPAAGVGRAMPAALLTPGRPVGLEEAVFAPTGRLGAETGVEAAGAGWPRGRLRAAPLSDRALQLPGSCPPGPAELGGPGARAQQLLGEGAARPRGSGGGGSRPGLMSKSMPFLGASLYFSPSFSKADRLPRVDFFSLREVGERRASALN